MTDLAIRVAVLENEHKHHTERLDHLIGVVEENNKLTKENNRIIERSKGIAFGASLIISSIWAAGLFIWNYFK